MVSELEPLVRHLGLREDGGLHRGRAGDVEVVALLTTIGMSAGERAARRLLDLGVDRVVVSGVAGGVSPEVVPLGALVVPEVVVDRRTGAAYRQEQAGDVAPRGTISCGDELLTDAATIAELVAAGVVALDMETAAVAAVCCEAGCSWSAFRAISDHAGDPAIDAELLAVTRPDGTADPDALARYLAARPERADMLARLAPAAAAAAETAALAAIASITG